MFKYMLSFVFLIGCATRPAPTTEPQGVCATLYDPHLCVVLIDSTTFAGYGSNECLALRKLKQTLMERDFNPLLAQKAECGRVFK